MLSSLIALVLVTLVSASAHPKRGVANVITSCSQANTAAITFDDGPYIWQNELVDMLEANGAKGTFFVNGDNWDCIYSKAMTDRIQRTFSKGHQIASHTWKHAHLPDLNKNQITQEFTKTQTAIQKITGAKVAFTRPPYGEYNDLVEQVAVEQKQNLVIWDFDSGDSAGKTVAQINKAYDSLTKKHPKTILSLNHEVQEVIKQTLPHAIQVLKGAGYKLVTVAECMGMEPYLERGAAGVRDNSWKC